jgi:hypothetical protein
VQESNSTLILRSPLCSIIHIPAFLSRTLCSGFAYFVCIPSVPEKRKRKKIVGFVAGKADV